MPQNYIDDTIPPPPTERGRELEPGVLEAARDAAIRAAVEKARESLDIAYARGHSAARLEAVVMLRRFASEVEARGHGNRMTELVTGALESVARSLETADEGTDLSKLRVVP